MKIMRVKQLDGTLVDIPIGMEAANSTVSTHNTNTSAHADIREQINDLNGALDDYVSVSQMGTVNGVATLDTNGKVSTSQLPSMVNSLNGHTGNLTINCDAINAVSYFDSQTLAEFEKVRARGNIGAFEDVSEPWTFELADGTIVVKAIGVVTLDTHTINNVVYYHQHYTNGSYTLWSDWINSSYNTDNYQINDTSGVITNAQGYAIQLGGIEVLPDDRIVNAGVYTITDGVGEPT